MPQTKTQGAVFGLLMSYFMALGMEVSNVAHKLGAMSNVVFLPILSISFISLPLDTSLSFVHTFEASAPCFSTIL